MRPKRDTEPAERGQRTDTRTRILDSAERSAQARGYNGFSYADVASELGITKASLHYHFASKTELGKALIDRYLERFAAALTDIDSRLSEAPAKLDAYAALYSEVLRGDRMCLCGMLAAEHATLPRSITNGLTAFFDRNEAWLERVLEQGSTDGSLTLSAPSAETAQLIVSTLEGAMLVARPYGEFDRFESVVTSLLASLTGLRER
jgi:TetR/AcrR family transcriptional repressor of nem operon